MKIWLPAIRGGSGTDVFTRRLAEALRRRGIASDVTWFSSHFQLAPFLLRHVSPPPGTTLIHANSWNAFAFKRTGIPLVVTEHLNVLDHRYRPYKGRLQHIYHEFLVRRFAAASFREASEITAVSHFTASGLKRSLGVDKVHVIPNWSDTRTFLPADDPPRVPARPFRLLFVGNLSKRKGADLLVAIMRQLGGEFELRFTSGLQGFRRIPRVENMVPLGRLNGDGELLQAYRACDAFLFPSRFEGLPLAPLEAMACGKPVIAADTSSLPELIENGVSGILCPADDIDAFVMACRKLAAEPESCRQYGRAARSRTETVFSEDAIVPQYIALYRRLQDY